LLVGGLDIFVGGLDIFVGGLDIFAGAKLFTSASSYTYAVVTAGIAVLLRGLMSSLFGGSPVGAALALVAYLAVVKWRYGIGWLMAGAVAIVAWVSAVVVLTALASVGVGSFSAVGIPDV
jgi:hypothetical protein